MKHHKVHVCERLPGLRRHGDKEEMKDSACTAHGTIGATPGELATRFAMPCVHMRLPCFTGIPRLNQTSVEAYPTPKQAAVGKQRQPAADRKHAPRPVPKSKAETQKNKKLRAIHISPTCVASPQHKWRAIAK
jgi:hypothetical protein